MEQRYIPLSYTRIVTTLHEMDYFVDHRDEQDEYVLLSDTIASPRA